MALSLPHKNNPVIFLRLSHSLCLHHFSPATRVYYYGSSGFFRECARGDDSNRRFIVSFAEGGIDEVTLVKDVDLAGNSSVGIFIDWLRNRLPVALIQRGNASVTDVLGNKITKVGVDRLGSGIVYHPDGFLIVVHHSSGSLFKIKVKIDTGSKRDEEIKLIKVVGGPLTFGERLGILSPRKLVVAGIPTARLLKSSDGWETASVIGKLSAPAHRLPTAVAVKDERVYIN
ncbi:SGL domain-containing protein [Citrus sinensis]|uniref:SGL domain-containing protein n=1 Tax=Citrus sinensis TaxID=2711 RepID=A0ACB8MLH0_CITSI|nr:SGL domain-containing protein [Citrus sinensis]